MNSIETDENGHRISDYDGDPSTLKEAERNLREAVDVGCTNEQHDHVKDYRNAVIRFAAWHVDTVAQTMRDNTGEYPEEWSARDIRDAVESAAASLRCTQDQS